MLDIAIASMEGRNSFAGKRNTTWVLLSGAKSNGDVVEAMGLKEVKEEKKGWFSWGKLNAKQDNRKIVPPRSSLSVEGKVSDMLSDPATRIPMKARRYSIECGRRYVDAMPTDYRLNGYRNGKEIDGRKSISIETTHMHKLLVNDSRNASEYKKGLRLSLWLTS